MLIYTAILLYGAGQVFVSTFAVNVVTLKHGTLPRTVAAVYSSPMATLKALQHGADGSAQAVTAAEAVEEVLYEDQGDEMDDLIFSGEQLDEEDGEEEEEEEEEIEGTSSKRRRVGKATSSMFEYAKAEEEGCRQQATNQRYQQ